VHGLAVCLLGRHGTEHVRTVDVDIALPHELAKLPKALGGVDLGHVDGT
jgi:hypothetical protein